MSHRLIKSIPLLIFAVGIHSAENECNAAETSQAVTFRVMTWNIHHGEGLDQQVDLKRIATLIREERADIIALQEVDKGVERTKKRDLPAELAALIGMSVVFSNNYSFQGGEYGNATLSRFPIVSAGNLHYQKVNEKEQRGLLRVVLDVKGRKLVFLNTHLDHRPADDARWSNAAEIEAATRELEVMPVILCGDFNCPPESRVHERLSKMFADGWTLSEKAPGFTIPAEKPNRRIDYIWLRQNCGLTAKKAWVPESLASDHRPVIVEMELKPAGH
jgi:endonuclease/exonuclease/phosphatase family metal-dependent hydrolase